VLDWVLRKTGRTLKPLWLGVRILVHPRSDVWALLFLGLVSLLWLESQLHLVSLSLPGSWFR
jgi:hypothetical protein